MFIQHILGDVSLVLIGNQVVCEVGVASESPQAGIAHRNFLLRQKVSF
jgi:hypothetical protein